MTTRRPAFTLIELLAVLVVTGIMAAAALPAVRQMQTMRNRAAANTLQRDLTYARERAAATGACSWVVFNLASQSYSCLAESTASPGRVGAISIMDPATNAAFVRRIGQGESTGVTLDSVSFDTDGEVGFDRLGRPLRTNGTIRTSDGTVTLAGAWRVRVAARTGLVSVEAAP